jgi:hypothetical protein
MVPGRKDRETRKKWKGPMRWRKISRALDGDTMVLRCPVCDDGRSRR